MLKRLDTVSTDELLDELIARHDHVVFVALKDVTKESVISTRRWQGNQYVCMGLIDCIKLKIAASVLTGEREVKEF